MLSVPQLLLDCPLLGCPSSPLTFGVGHRSFNCQAAFASAIQKRCMLKAHQDLRRELTRLQREVAGIAIGSLSCAQL